MTLLKVDQELLVNAKKSQNKQHMFISNIQIEKSLHHYEAALLEAESKLHVQDIEFETNKELSTILEKSAGLGKVNTRENRETFLGLQATYFTSVDIRQSGDQTVPTITGATFLHNGDLLIVDSNNSKLTLLDTTLKVKNSTKCIEEPWDIAVISDQEVVLSACQTLQFYRVSPRLQFIRNIELDCWSVAVAKDSIYVSRSTPEILVLDTNGNRLRSIAPAQTRISFRELSYIALNPSGNKLYYSDCNGSQLICLTTDGKHIYTYTDPDLKSPRGLIVDDDDNVLIAGEDSNNIHVVRADGTKHNVLVTSSDSIQTPVGMAYNSTTNMLVVSEWDGEKLKIFKLNPL